MTAANGDKVFSNIEGIFDLATASSTGTSFVTGGTGRFENAEGFSEFTATLDSEGLIVVAHDSHISTVGEAKKE
jgi:hypothetical protein